MLEEKVTKNIKYSLANYVCMNILRFLVRMAFVRNLSTEYLGLNSLLMNILSVLSLVELGIGPAIVYSLYEPLSFNNKESIKSIMAVFKRAYTVIGIVILIVGLLLMPYLSWLIKGDIYGIDVKSPYFLYLLYISVSYFGAYQRNLLLADQKQYIVNMYQLISQSILAIVQIGILYLYQNYCLFIGVLVICTIFENYFINKRVYKDYAFLKEEYNPLTIEVKVEIIRNIKAMIAHKIGDVVVFSSSNMMISKFIGLTVVGLYTNYYMVITAVNSFAVKFFSSITASIGNLMLTGDENDKRKAFRILEFVTAYQAAIIAIGLYVLFDSFIEIWLGKAYFLEEHVVVGMIISFYITYMRNSVLTFKSACGLFWQDRYKPLIEGIVNLCAGIYLSDIFGLAGIVYGNVITTVFVCFCIEPYVLFKYGVSMSLKKYFFNCIVYMISTFIMAILIKNITFYVLDTTNIWGFVLGVFWVILCVVMFWNLLFWNKEESRYVRNIIVEKVKHIIFCHR